MSGRNEAQGIAISSVPAAAITSIPAVHSSAQATSGSIGRAWRSDQRPKISDSGTAQTSTMLKILAAPFSG